MYFTSQRTDTLISEIHPGGFTYKNSAVISLLRKCIRTLMDFPLIDII